MTIDPSTVFGSDPDSGGAADTAAGGAGGTGSGAPPPGTPHRPDTKITARTIKKAAKSATFAFKTSGSGSSFQCAPVKPRAGHPHPKPAFAACRSPKTYRHLGHGKFTFYVRAVGSAGPDLTPARARFRL